jgi:hypothetical protein
MLLPKHLIVCMNLNVNINYTVDIIFGDMMFILEFLKLIILGTFPEIQHHYISRLNSLTIEFRYLIPNEYI